MTCYETYNICIQAALCLGTIASICFGIFTYIKQKQHSFYANYTERFSRIMENMPESFFQSKTNKEQSEQITHCIRLYIDLCSEELHHYKNKRISDKDWKEVREGMTLMFENERMKKVIEKGDMLNGYKDLSNYLEEITQTFQK